MVPSAVSHTHPRVAAQGGRPQGMSHAQLHVIEMAEAHGLWLLWGLLLPHGWHNAGLSTPVHKVGTLQPDVPLYGIGCVAQSLQNVATSMSLAAPPLPSLGGLWVVAAAQLGSSTATATKSSRVARPVAIMCTQAEAGSFDTPWAARAFSCPRQLAPCTPVT